MDVLINGLHSGSRFSRSANSPGAFFSLASAMTGTSPLLQFYEMVDSGAAGGREGLKFTRVWGLSRFLQMLGDERRVSTILIP